MGHKWKCGEIEKIIKECKTTEVTPKYESNS